MMPQVPSLPPDQMKAASVAAPTNPVNFLLAAAEAHSQGDFQSAPVPKGIDIQTGKGASRRKHLKVLK